MILLVNERAYYNCNYEQELSNYFYFIQLRSHCCAVRFEYFKHILIGYMRLGHRYP